MNRSPLLPETGIDASMVPGEYIADRISGHETPAHSAHRRSARLRTLYFVVASSWGFGIGVVALAAAQNVFGRAVPFSPNLIAVLIPAFAVAAVGGAVAAAAYREARNRARR